MHNYYLPAVLAMLVVGYAVDYIIERLNVAHASSSLPREFDGYYDPEKYAKSQSYLREKTGFGLVEGAVFTAGTIVFILAGWFNMIDVLARSLGAPQVVTGLLFMGAIYLLSYLGSIPFSAYRTFVIEEKYGFNRTTPGTFIGDIFRQILLAAVFGGIALGAILAFFGFAGSLAWLYSWIAMTAFELFTIFIAPVTILPLFNKYTPLEEGGLKDAIVEYAASQHFKIKGIYKMDASRRSSKTNAFFIGFGKYKRIVLFDTLIEKMKTDEIVSVLAHEVGHYRHRDTFKALAMSILSSGIMFFTLSFFIDNRDLAAAFKMEDISVYAGLLFFTFIYSPVSWALAVTANYISRRFEYAADAFSVATYRRPEATIDSFKRLSVDNLTNLTPHPLKVFVSYSHPPVMKRIEAIKRVAASLKS